MTDEKTRRAEYAEATRRALVQAGRRLFADKGYAETSTEEIVRQARVTRGALYHHFKGKAELFRAVVEQMEQDMVGRIARAAYSSSDPWEIIKRGCDEFLDACLDPDVQRILVLDSKSVLPWEVWREIQIRYGFGATEAALVEGMKCGAIEQQASEPLTYMLLGAMQNTATFIAESADPEAAREEAGKVLKRLLEGLRPRR